mgnify:FL=1|tara:strand:- start:1060 stop:1392 length:333 start_codon:yes stop_codon:yes gene_type:complete
MSLDHEAIYKAYAGTVVSIDDGKGAFDASGNSVTLDQSLVDAARATLDAEAAATLYQRQRTGVAGTTDTIYPSIGDQLDNLYKDILAGTLTTSGAFATAIKAVKDKYPKP